MANNKTVKGKKAEVSTSDKPSKKLLAKQVTVKKKYVPVPPVANRWKKGQSGNPKGRGKNIGYSIKEFLTQMSELTLDEIKTIFVARKTPVNKKIAARLLLDAASGVVSKTGVPIAGPEFDRVMDRTVGRPKQEVELTGKDGKALAIEHGGPKPEWDKLSTEELTLVEGILVKTIEGEKQRNQLPAPSENGNGKAEK